ncbi:unnamed protein product [Cylindrotheca closterium]|uniref:Kinesin motor domain-containing protein n=1 Tax=Cylindrotheca closterium TaxID=2856 RepID=A0AAD2FYN1_9STRA|nr:unnamed protein product [Cylindrotheca closterium]
MGATSNSNHQRLLSYQKMPTRSRSTNIASRYQESWKQFKQKQQENHSHHHHAQDDESEELNQVRTTEHKKKKELNQVTNRPSIPPNPSNSRSLNKNNNKRVSFQGLNSKPSQAQTHAKTKQQQDSQTKHPKQQRMKSKSKSPSFRKPVVASKSSTAPRITTAAARIPIAKPTKAKERMNKMTERQTSTLTTQSSSSTFASANSNSASNTNNVSVVVRLRPIVPHETKRGAHKVVHKVRTIDSVLNGAKENDEEVVRVELAPTLAKASNNRELVKCFALDGVLEEQDSQEDVYKRSGAYKAISQDLFRGFHCTILAYGQSGSGKTYTMGTMASKPQSNTASNSTFAVTGSDVLDPEAGVIQRACHDLFQQVEEQCMGDATVELSYLEIYNEELRDLLSTKTSKLSHSSALQQQKERERLAQQEGLPLSPNSSGSQGGLQIREDTDGQVFVQGKTSVAVTNAEQVIELMRLANAKRVVASTKLNEVSSRSHAICILTVTGTNSYDVTFQSRLTLVDLAGSERLSKTENTGWRAKEGININMGLYVLGLVISALTETRSAHKRHPPYRESKLTRILQNSLGGNARTIMIACCSPTDYHCEETVNTLRYATQARNIENPVMANIVHDEHAEQVLQLQSEKDQLAKTNSTLQEQIAEYEMLIRQISSELSHVKQHYQTTTLELTEVKQDYQTTAEQLMEIQEDFKMTVDQLKKEKIEEVLKKQTRRQKRLSSSSFGQQQQQQQQQQQSYWNDEDEELRLMSGNNSFVDTPTRSIQSAFAENSIGTEPTADMTIGTTPAVTPEVNRLVPPSPPVLQEDDNVDEANADVAVDEANEDAALEKPEEPLQQEEQIGETSIPEQQEQEPSNEPPEEPEDGSAAGDDESVPLSQVAPECDHSQAISLLTEHQEWNATPEQNPLLGDLTMVKQEGSEDMDAVSLSKALEQAAESQDLDDETKELQLELEAKEESSLTTEVHEPLSTSYVPEDEKKELEENNACDSSYQKCKTNTLYCNDNMVDKESEVMVEAVPVGMDDFTGVRLSSTMSSSNNRSATPQSKSKMDQNSVQSGTVTQGSQATTASGKRRSTLKNFFAKWNCMSGVYGTVHEQTPTTTITKQTQKPSVKRL